MAMKKNNRDYIAQMNKGMKQKLSMLLIACLLFTGYHGLTISGRAEQEEKEQTNEISVSGTQVKVQLLGEDIRRAAKEAIEKGDRVEAAALQGYSGDEDLQKEYAEIFSSEKEVYEIPLDSISEGLSESLAEEEAGLQVFVERDAKDLERLVRKESKESLLLYDGNSQLSQLFPETKQEEAKSAVEKEQESGAEEALLSDSNIEKTERNTELTGSELITFLYKNKADHRISFQLSVDGNTYPKVVVSPKTQLFKSFLDKLKKEEKKQQAETTVVASTEAKESTVEEERTETEATESAEEKEESESESVASSVSLVSAEGSEEETTVTESTAMETAMEASAEEETIAEESTEAEAGEAETTVSETVAETAVETKAVETKATEVKEDKAIFEGFLQEVIEHYEEFLGELQAARFTQYSLNELGRKTQNVEIEGFATVEVFYDKETFVDEEGNEQEVRLEAKRLVKPGEEGKEGEELTGEQIKLMQESGIYENSDSLDIRFVKNGEEVEPKEGHPVTVRLTFYKEAVPAEATADTIAIHHIVEKEGKAQYIETVLRSEVDKQAEKVALGLAELSEEKEDTENVVSDEFGTEEASFGEKEELSSETQSSVRLTAEEEKTESKENITKEFTVNSFSGYVIYWKDDPKKEKMPIRVHLVDEAFRELRPTVMVNGWLGITDNFDTRWPKNTKPITLYQYDRRNQARPYVIPDGEAQDWGINFRGKIPGFKISEAYGLPANQEVSKDNLSRYELLSLNSRYYTYQNGGGAYHDSASNNVRDFYLVYYICKKNNCPKELAPPLFNDKYITANEDGTYNLTLTGQLKEKLDVLFIYDNTGNIDEELAKETKEKICGLMDDLSVYDSRFAFISMNSEKNPSVDEAQLKPINNGQLDRNDEITTGTLPEGTLGDLSQGKLSPAFGENEIKDARYNDVRTIEFRNRADIKAVINKLNKVAKPPSKGTGANYAAAIRDAKSLMNWWDKTSNPDVEKDATGDWTGAFGNFDRTKVTGSTRDAYLQFTNNANLVRKDAKAVVIFIAGGNPTKLYAPEKGTYEDYVQGKDGKYYLSRGKYEKGQSIGNGRTFNHAAFNSARSELTYFVSLDDFYTIGIGDGDTSQLRDMTVMLPNQVTKEDFQAKTKEEIGQCFKAIKNKYIKNPDGLYNVTIQDTLSDNVELVKDKNNKPYGQWVKLEENRVEEHHVVTEAERITEKLPEINVVVSPNKKTVTLTTAQLNISYQLQLVMKIKPKNGVKGEPDMGDPRTDLNDIYRQAGLEPKGDEAKYGTSAGKKGLFTNKAGKTETYIRASYCGPCGGGTITKPYPNPVIRVVPKDYITVEKLVKENNAVIEDDLYHRFMFYFIVTDRNGNSLLEKDLRTLAESMDADAQDKMGKKTVNDKQIIDVQGITIDGKRYQAIPFSMIHERKVKFSLPKNSKNPYRYMIVEEKVEDYDKPEMEFTGGNSNPPRQIELVELNAPANYYIVRQKSVGPIPVADGDYVLIKNIKKSNEPPTPTGLVRDITPYIFSIFGFTLMAGAYFAINKKKRREI